MMKIEKILDTVDRFATKMQDAGDSTFQKAREIESNGKIKQIDCDSFTVHGVHTYKVSIDRVEKMLVCECEGCQRYQYCKHSIALYMFLENGNYDYSMTSKEITDEELNPIKKIKIYEASAEEVAKMELITEKMEAEQNIIKNSIPVLEIPYDMYQPVSFGKYVELDGELDVLAQMIKEGLPFLIEGDKGIGKTLAVNTVCVREKIPMVAYSCSSGTTMGDILGREHILGEDSVFELGLLPKAIEVANHFGKGVLYLDELSALEPEIQKMLNSIIDARRSVSINGHIYRLKKDTVFNIIGTMNPSNYGGTSPLNEDLRSRFVGEVWKYPSAMQLSTIIDWTGLDQKTVQKPILQLAMDTLGMRQKGELEYVLSTRDIELFAKTYRALKPLYKNDKELIIKTIKTAVLIKFGSAEDRELVRTRAEESFAVIIPRE